ncbi:MAG: hypothetical protein DWQ01_00880 [Planctomycetota bacterium]|nr:MAG: hypothetical protein DWQ01_00880 [Planctomycetota bacterium]
MQNFLQFLVLLYFVAANHLSAQEMQSRWLAVNLNGDVFQLNSEDGSQIWIGHSGWPNLNCMAYSPAHGYFSFSNGTVIFLDPETGWGTKVVQTPLDRVCAAALDLSGNLYAVQDGLDGTFDLLYRMDLTTGDVRFVGPIPFHRIEALESLGEQLFAWDCVAGLITIEKNSGFGTDVGPEGSVCANVYGLAKGPNGRLFGARLDFNQINPTTGGLISMGGRLNDLRGLAFLPPKISLVEMELESGHFFLNGASSHQPVAFLISARPGNWVLSTETCTQTILQVGPPVFPHLLLANDRGQAEFQLLLPPSTGELFVQALDLSTCLTSNRVGPLSLSPKSR